MPPGLAQIRLENARPSTVLWPIEDTSRARLVVLTLKESAMGMFYIAAVTVLGTVGQDSLGLVVRDQVDLIEVNHFFDEHGNRILDQVIFYDWSGPDGRFHVRDWRLLKKPGQLPVRCWKTGTYRCIWYDGNTMREVEATDVRETWTQHDPEVTNRKFLPRSSRRTLQRKNVSRTAGKAVH